MNYPDVCTSAPVHGKAFCQEHLDFLSTKHPAVPTDIRGLLKHCGVVKHSDTPEGKCIQVFVLIFMNYILMAHDQNEIGLLISFTI